MEETLKKKHLFTNLEPFGQMIGITLTEQSLTSVIPTVHADTGAD